MHACESILSMIIGCSVLEQKVEQMEAELARKQQEREDSAQQIKKYVAIPDMIMYRAELDILVVFHAE